MTRERTSQGEDMAGQSPIKHGDPAFEDGASKAAAPAERTAAKVVPLRVVAPAPQVAPEPQVDTIELLRWLLREAEAGELIGLAYTALYRGRNQWACGTTGEADRNKAYAIGLLNVHSAALSAAVANEVGQ